MGTARKDTLTERFTAANDKGLSGGGAVVAPVQAAGAFMHTNEDWLRLAAACLDQGMRRGDRKLEQALTLMLDVLDSEDE